jgi:hypothetical protein
MAGRAAVGTVAEESMDARKFEIEGGVYVFRPTLEEMADFAGYVRFMESCGAAEAGLAKVRSSAGGMVE